MQPARFQPAFFADFVAAHTAWPARAARPANSSGPFQAQGVQERPPITIEPWNPFARRDPRPPEPVIVKRPVRCRSTVDGVRCENTATLVDSWGTICLCHEHGARFFALVPLVVRPEAT